MEQRPVFPGEILKEIYMIPLHLSIKDVADHLELSKRILFNIINGHSPVSVDIAMRLSRAFSTTPGFWLNLQQKVDIWNARENGKDWKNITPLYIPPIVPEETLPENIALNQSTIPITTTDF